MSRLLFEKVGDINFVYPYLCVYMHGEQEDFMEIDSNRIRPRKPGRYRIWSDAMEPWGTSNQRR